MSCHYTIYPFTNILMFNLLICLDIISTLKEMGNMHVLNMLGNPVVRKTKDYRRHMIFQEFHFYSSKIINP